MRQFSAEHILGNIFVRPNHLENVGDCMEGHEHNFDHVSFVTSGAALAEGKSPDGTVKKVTVRAGGYVLIRKEVHHKFTALEPNTIVLCVYAHRTPQGEVSEEYTGWDRAYE